MIVQNRMQCTKETVKNNTALYLNVVGNSTIPFLIFLYTTNYLILINEIKKFKKISRGRKYTLRIF